MRLIDADELKTLYDDAEFADEKWRVPIRVILANIDDMPTIDPVKHGRWIYYEDETIEDGGRCSVCGGEMLAKWSDHAWRYVETDYCPYCGAKMDEVEE